jgi:hypothetical protein
VSDDERCQIARILGSLRSGAVSDMLGYDFIVAMKSTLYYYEVKASIGDPHRFDMGPTEIGAAQRHRSDRDHRIAFCTCRMQAILRACRSACCPTPSL